MTHKLNSRLSGCQNASVRAFIAVCHFRLFRTGLQVRHGRGESFRARRRRKLRCQPRERRALRADCAYWRKHDPERWLSWMVPYRGGPYPSFGRHTNVTG